MILCSFFQLRVSILTTCNFNFNSKFFFCLIAILFQPLLNRLNGLQDRIIAINKTSVTVVNYISNRLFSRKGMLFDMLKRCY